MIILGGYFTRIIIKNPHNYHNILKQHFLFPETLVDEQIEIERIQLFSDKVGINKKKKRLSYYFILECLSFFSGCIAIILSLYYVPYTFRLIFTYPLLFLWLLFFSKYVLSLSLGDIFLHHLKKPIEKHRWFYFFTVFIVILLLAKITLNFLESNTFLSQLLENNNILRILYSCVEAPIIEELIFRGFFYQRMQNWNKTSYKINKNSFLFIEAFFSAVLFGLWHFFNFFIAYSAFFVGFFLCWLRNEWGESLILGIFIHAMYNFSVMGIA